MAAISANNDRSIGDLIAGAMDKVGREGAISIEDGSGLVSELEVVEGLQFDRGYLSPYFVNNAEKPGRGAGRRAIVLLRPEAVVAAGPGAAARASRQVGRPLLVIAEDVDSDALATLVVNSVRGVVQDLRGEGAGLRRSAQGDAAGHGRADRRPLIADELGLTLAKTRSSHLGRARRIEVGKDNTTIIGGAGDAAGDRGAHRSDPEGARARRPATTTASSSTSASPSSPAAWR